MRRVEGDVGLKEKRGEPRGPVVEIAACAVQQHDSGVRLVCRRGGFLGEEADWGVVDRELQVCCHGELDAAAYLWRVCGGSCQAFAAEPGLVAYAGAMGSFGQDGALLLLDTCGERASLAVALDGHVATELWLEERAASGALLGAVREALGSAGVELRGLAGIGVVNGPGSFTGVRVGVAMAKGLCEAAGVPLAAVSRLTVLAEAGGLRQGFVALSAGRDQVYVREVGAERDGVEWMLPAESLRDLAAGREVVYAEERVAVLLSEGVQLRRVALSAASSLLPVQRCLREGGSDLALADANYVRPEEAIYRAAQHSGSAGRE